METLAMKIEVIRENEPDDRKAPGEIGYTFSRLVNPRRDELIASFVGRYDTFIVFDVPEGLEEDAERLARFHLFGEESRSGLRIKVTDGNGFHRTYDSTEDAAWAAFGDRRQIEIAIRFKKEAYGNRYEVVSE